ncbi:MAG: ATP-binding protein [Actinomycetota bacterium]
MKVIFTLLLPRDAATVPIVRQLCRSTFETLGIEDECSSDLELVVTEACTNVLKHASGGDHEYEVQVTTAGQGCEIQVKDAGRGFDHAAVGTEVAHVAAEGGRGVHLMRVLVDELRFVSDEGSGTMVYLQKSLQLKERSPLQTVGAQSASVRPYTG